MIPAPSAHQHKVEKANRSGPYLLPILGTQYTDKLHVATGFTNTCNVKEHFSKILPVFFFFQKITICNNYSLTHQKGNGGIIHFHLWTSVHKLNFERINCYKQTPTSVGITLNKLEWNIFIYLPEDSVVIEAKNKVLWNISCICSSHNSLPFDLPSSLFYFKTSGGIKKTGS